MMKICLIRPSRFMVLSAITMNPAPPLGLAFVAAVLRAEGHQVKVIDSIAEAPNQINPLVDKYVSNGLSMAEIAALIPEDTDVIGVSCMFSMNWIVDRALIDFLGEKFPKAVLIAGGEHITAAPDFSLQQAKNLQVSVLGEAEETIVELIKAFEFKTALSNVKGIVFKDDQGKCIHTEKRNRIKTLDEIPYPAWDLLPVEAYQENNMVYGVTKERSLPILASRGCPYTCTFCSNPVMWGKKYTIRTPQQVATEIEFLYTQFQIKNFDFFDLTAILKKDWVVEFSSEIIKRGINITWQLPAGTRSEAIDRECAKALYLSGCRYLSYAPESGSPEILRIIKKKIKLSRMLESMRFAYEEKLHIKLNMIFGLPDERHIDIWKTYWFLIQCSWIGVHEIGPSSFQPYPGSALFNRLVNEGKINMETDQYFFEMVKSDNFFQNSFYNDNMSIRWMQFYQILGIVIFYVSNFLFRPSRFFKLLRGVITRDYNSKLEAALVALFTRNRFNAKTLKPAVEV
ncbi:MAG: cobalamin-dependent protein [Chitinophagales bacterium]|nr:cobalamin-dependent protein [Chitinophagales bacterium]